MNGIKNICVANYGATFGEIGRKKIFYCVIEANQNDPGEGS